MVVNGGLAWWRDFVCAACHVDSSSSSSGGCDELRFYPRDAKLDNTFAASARLPCPAVLINVFRDILIVLATDCHVLIFRMERRSGQQCEYIAGPGVIILDCWLTSRGIDPASGV